MNISAISNSISYGQRNTRQRTVENQHFADSFRRMSQSPTYEALENIDFQSITERRTRRANDEDFFKKGMKAPAKKSTKIEIISTEQANGVKKLIEQLETEKALAQSPEDARLIGTQLYRLKKSLGKFAEKTAKAARAARI